MRFNVFRRIVRPSEELSLEEAQKFILNPTKDPILLYGIGDEAVSLFDKIAKNVGYGSALVIFGVPTESADVVDRVEEIARKNSFRTWHRGRVLSEFTEDTRSWIKSDYDGNTNWTHRSYLCEAVNKTTGAVLELGSGDGSTILLHSMCEKQNKILVTVDNNEQWLSKFRYLTSSMHIFEGPLSNPAETKWLNEKWGVVFVDHAPGETRGKAINRAKDLADYIVIHDTEELSYGIEDLLSTFKFRKDFRRMRPWTSVVSMTKEIFEYNS